jgi:hypothetical protein
VNNSGVWRAVHEALTSDDEGLLQCVARLVPYSFAGQLRDAAETTAQLQALAGSRPVPPKVRAREQQTAMGKPGGLWVMCICYAMGAADTTAQLQELTGSRPVPPKVSVWCDGF